MTPTTDSFTTTDRGSGKVCYYYYYYYYYYYHVKRVKLLIIRHYLAGRKPKLRGQVTTNVTVRLMSNDCANKNVFKRCLKVATDGAVMTSVGRLFHTRGAAAPNARSPIVRATHNLKPYYYGRYVAIFCRCRSLQSTPFIFSSNDHNTPQRS